MKNQKKIYLIISIVSLVIVVAASAAIGFLLYSFKQARDDYSQLANQAREGKPSVFWDREE